MQLAAVDEQNAALPFEGLDAGKSENTRDTGNVLTGPPDAAMIVSCGIGLFCHQCLVIGVKY